MTELRGMNRFLFFQFFIYILRGQIKNRFIFKDWTIFKIILDIRSFRGGLDEKIRRMWLGRKSVVVGLPSLIYNISNGIVN